MVPADLRKDGALGEDPTEVVVGEVASLAYEMAVRGDLRLVQQTKPHPWLWRPIKRREDNFRDI